MLRSFLSGLYFHLTWYGSNDAVMHGQGMVVELDYTADERTALGEAMLDPEQVWGETTFDVYMNNHANRRNVPSAVWSCHLGATRSSRNGCPTGRAKCCLARYSQKRRSASPTRRGELLLSCITSYRTSVRSVTAILMTNHRRCIDPATKITTMV